MTRCYRGCNLLDLGLGFFRYCRTGNDASCRKRVTVKHAKFDKVSLKQPPVLTERWGQDPIAEGSSLLGLGENMQKGRVHIRPRVSRRDLLLRAADSGRRTEVEVFPGPADETRRHVIAHRGPASLTTVESADLCFGASGRAGPGSTRCAPGAGLGRLRRSVTIPRAASKCQACALVRGAAGVWSADTGRAESRACP